MLKLKQIINQSMLIITIKQKIYKKLSIKLKKFKKIIAKSKINLRK